MKEFWKLLKPQRKRMALFAALLLVSTTSDLLLPAIMSSIVNVGINSGNMRYIWIACGIMVGVAAIGLAALLGSIKVSTDLSVDFAADVRREAFRRAESLTHSEYSKIGTGALLTRTIEDISWMQDVVVMALQCAVMIPVLLFGGAALAFSKDVWLSLILILCAPFLIGAALFIGKKLEPRIAKSELYQDKQNTIVRERLSGIRVIRAFNRENTEHNRMAKATRVMADNIIRANVTSGMLSPVSMLVLNMVTVLIVFVGAKRTEQVSWLAAGDIVAVIQYVALIMNAVILFSMIILYLPRFRVATRRIGEVFTAQHIERDSEARSLSGTIRCQDVSFRYENAEEPAISGITLEIEEGEVVALIGGTGSGKSTLLQLLCGAYLPTGGTMTFGGEMCESMTPNDWSKNVSVAFQKPDIFSGTIRENVLPMGGTQEALDTALDVAQLKDFAERMGGDGYVLNQAGANLSGGQKQRLAIARALAGDAAVYLFDDSFSALDYLTEYRLRSRLKTYLFGKTQIIATQRVATARNCDKIFVFENGRIVGSGKHEQLMQCCPLYREIAFSQGGGDLRG